MAYEMKPGQGSMFRADKQGSDRAPDYEGKANIGGTFYRIAGWIKEGKEGRKWLSLNIDLPKSHKTPSANPIDLDDDIPY